MPCRPLDNCLLDLEDELAAGAEVQGPWNVLRELAELDAEHEIDRELERLKRGTATR